MIRTIVIKFGDNDFGKTFIPIMKALSELFDYDPYISEPFVQWFIRNCIKPYYVAYQHSVHHRNINEHVIDDTVRYLQGIEILFDEEAEKILNEDHDGGYWYLLPESKQYGSF